VIEVGVAEQRDSAELCRLVKQVPVPGAISLVYGRDPDFFAFLPAEGRANQVPMVKKDGVINTIAVRSIRSLYVNGSPVALGYLHGLRTLPVYRGKGYFARGFLHMRSLHEKDGKVLAYLVTVIDARTQAMFTKPRRNFPRFFDKGKYITCALPLKRKRKTKSFSQSIERGSKETLPEIIRFLNDNGRQRQYFPVYSELDFSRFAACGLLYEDIFIVRSRGAIEAVLGVWDQGAYKQSIVHSYNGLMRYARPFVNAGLRTAGYCALPGAGERFGVAYACFACSKDDRREPLAVLLSHALCEWSGRGFHYLIIGFHQRDPLRRIVQGRPAIAYASRVYCAAWEDGWEFCRGVSDQSIPYLEACLL
jgi:hypothetical protein